MYMSYKVDCAIALAGGQAMNGFPRSGRIIVAKDNTIHGPFYYKMWMDKSLYYTLNGWWHAPVHSRAAKFEFHGTSCENKH